MNKEHLEIYLTIKASYKVGDILELIHLQIAPFLIYHEVECMHLHGGNRPGEQKNSQFECPKGSSIRNGQLYFYIYMTINSLNIIEKLHQRLGGKF